MKSFEFFFYFNSSLSPIKPHYVMKTMDSPNVWEGAAPGVDARLGATAVVVAVEVLSEVATSMWRRVDEEGNL